MEIKTKYDIGDKVWIMTGANKNIPTEFRICDIEVHKHWLRDTLIFYSSDSTEGIVGLEEEVFPTKEELLKQPWI